MTRIGQKAIGKWTANVSTVIIDIGNFEFLFSLDTLIGLNLKKIRSVWALSQHNLRREVINIDECDLAGCQGGQLVLGATQRLGECPKHTARDRVRKHRTGGSAVRHNRWHHGRVT